MKSIIGYLKKLRAQSWVESHFSQLSAGCQSARTFEALGHTLLSGLAPLLDVVHGLFFVVDRESRTLIRVARYGGADRGETPDCQVGAGLVTQCVQEKKPLIIVPPEDYFYVGSGLGKSVPKTLWIHPVMMGDRVLGVLELATFQTFNQNQQALLNHLTPFVAMALEILGSHRQIRHLLETAPKHVIETAPRRAEAAMAALEERSRLILASVSDGIIGVDRDNRTIFVNPAAVSMLGYTTEELLDQPLHHLVHYAHPNGDRHTLEDCYVFQTTRDGQPRKNEDDVLWRKNGTALPVEYTTTPMYRADELIGTTLVFRDITERKRAEAAIREAHEQQHAIFESATVGITFLKERIFQNCNRKFYELLGYDRGELIGQSLRCLYPDAAGYEDVERAYDDLERGEVHQRVQKVQRRDGSCFWCHMSGSIITPGDLSRGTVWTFADVTHEREAVKSLQQAKDMAESVARMKSDFLANMSHEIRTPMNAIIGLSHLTLKTELTTRQRDYLEKIQGSGQHLLGIVNDILDLSKIDAGKLRIDQTEFDLEKVLDHVANMVAEKSSAKGLEVVFDIDPLVPRYLVGDPLRLRQILINYANNAVKFTEQGEVGLRVRVCGETDQAIWLHFSIQDTGPGLTEEQKGRLFQSFSQVDQSATRRFGGTGLGLAISRRLAELMGGTVGVDSVSGQGSRFWFTARLGRVAHQPHARLPTPQLRGRRVLVVDDNDHARMVLVEMLTGMTFDVTAVASGQAAVEAIRWPVGDRPYDLVTMDWQMPGMDGFETARQIRALGLAERPPLLMITAHGFEEVFKRADEAGIEEVLVKPVSPSILFNAAVRALGGLPQKESVAIPAFQVTEELATRQGARILLVEDNELNQEVALVLLTEAGFEVDLAVNGELAVQQVQQTPYDLVLMDMQMPVMDGVTATREIRQLPLCAELPIVAMTANAMQEDREQCEAAGMNDYLAKPIDPEALWQTLLKWIKPRSTPAKTGVKTRTTPPVTSAKHFDLPRIQGLDMTMGLRRVLNKPSLYLSTLRKFLDTQKAVPNAIVTALDAGDWALAERLAHTLKGLAGSIGARDLQDEAARLETAIKAQPQRALLDDRFTAMVAYLAPLIAELETKLPPVTTHSPNILIDEDRLREICAKLATHLADEDYAANLIFEANAPLLQAGLGDDDYREIEHGIGQFDFEKALQVLTRAAERANIFKHRKSTS